jgi:hypothetical protein
MEMVISIWTNLKLYKENVGQRVTHCKEATKGEPSAWGYNWTTLFLGDINKAVWPSRLWKSQI